MKSILLIRKTNNRIHKTHLKENVIMHIDIINKLIKKALSKNIRAELIKSVLDNGYYRED